MGLGSQAKVSVRVVWVVSFAYYVRERISYRRQSFAVNCTL